MARSYQQIVKQIDALSQAYQPVRIVAVSKRHLSEKIRALYALGQRDFAENYLQEALPKIKALADLAIKWHFIGPIQSNKCKQIAAGFHWVQSVDRYKIARLLAEHREPQASPLQICLQVNINQESQKAGLAPAEVEDFAAALRDLPRLSLRGIMAIPQVALPRAELLATFYRLRSLFANLQQAGFAVDTLSMGMSDDYPLAIQAGATMVRLGTCLFGPRR